MDKSKLLTTSREPAKALTREERRKAIAATATRVEPVERTVSKNGCEGWPLNEGK